MSAEANNKSLNGKQIAAAAAGGAVAVAALAYAAGWMKVRALANGRQRPKQPSADDLPAPHPVGVAAGLSEPAELPISLAKQGRGAAKPTTVFEVFDLAVKKHGDADAFKFEVPDSKDPKKLVWQSMSYKQYQKLSKQAAEAFIHLGVEKLSAVAIIGFNSPEWHIANMGAIYAGAFSAGIYTTNKPPAAQYIVNHSKAVVIVVENGSQLEKFLGADLPSVKAIVVYQEDAKVKADVQSKLAKHTGSAKVMFWSEFLALGEKPSGQLPDRVASQTPSSVSTLIYTSGTTGNPKAVMLTHDSVTWTAGVMFEAVPDWGKETPERIISYLPLSHIAAQFEDIFLPLGTTACRKYPVTVWFARPDAMKGSLGGTLKDCRPTIFFGVPRVWEKFMEKMQSLGKNAAGLRKWIATTAKFHGLQQYHALQADASGKFSPFFFFFKKIVFNTIRNALGLDQARICLTGAAPITKETLNYFGSLGITIHNVFGMSETTGPISSTRINWYSVGSIGVPFEGVDVRIDHVPGRDKPGEGEITFKGRSIMLGYLREPAKTAEMFDDKGYLKSGDVGRYDENGILWVTGRIKELLITAGGENIAPVPIEESILKNLPALSNVMLIGDKKKYNSVLVTLKVEVDENGLPTQKLTGDALLVSGASTTVGEAKNDSKWKDYIEKGLKKYNAEAVSQAQQVQKFRILDRDFSLGGGELTDTLKLKRNVVTKQYEALIDSIYAEDEKE
jgi:long-chain-fatty-acid--CoA ligase ACSBG